KDHRALCAQSFRDRRILLRNFVFFRVETRTGGGAESFEVETILQRNGQPVKRRLVISRKCACAKFFQRAIRFNERPSFIEREVYISSGVLIRVRKCLRGQLPRGHFSCQKRRAKFLQRAKTADRIRARTIRGGRHEFILMAIPGNSESGRSSESAVTQSN